MSENIHEVIEIGRPVTLAEDAKGIQAYIAATEITDQTAYEKMVKAVQAVSTLITKVIAHHAEMKEKAHAAHKAVCKAESDLTGPLADAKKTGKRKMDIWDGEQDRIRREATAKLREEAEAKEAKERAKLAKKAEKAGDTEKAAEILAAPSEVQVFVAEAPKVEGVSHSVVWGAYEILDFALIPDEYKMLDAKKTRAYGVAMKQDARVNGLRFYSTKQTAVSQ